MEAHVCGGFDNGTKKCCKYCSHFALWGISTGYCTEKEEDFSTWDEACDKFDITERKINYVNE